MKWRWNFGSALVVALLLHAMAYAAGLGWMAWQRRMEEMDIDLAQSSLLPQQPFQGRQVYRPPKEWLISQYRKLAPRPVPTPIPLKTATPEPQEATAVVPTPPCPPPCPGNPSDWGSAAQAVRKPQWISGLITQDDYPEKARVNGITGLVEVQVLIDDQGAVRDVRLLQGSSAILDDKTLEKLRQARFSPCEDGEGKPFPCAVNIPIDWTLN
jgi:TonB family protein